VPKILIFGNSGSGKSTLAKKLATEHQCSHLDLDTLAWRSTTPLERTDLNEIEYTLENFFNNNPHWIIEGCYGDLINLISAKADEMIFMNLDIEACMTNARNRPWEPHKYESKAAQDNNLSMLLEWIQAYKTRDDDFSYASHRKIYDSFPGNKKMIQENA